MKFLADVLEALVVISCLVFPPNGRLLVSLQPPVVTNLFNLLNVLYRFFVFVGPCPILVMSPFHFISFIIVFMAIFLPLFILLFIYLGGGGEVG